MKTRQPPRRGRTGIRTRLPAYLLVGPLTLMWLVTQAGGSVAFAREIPAGVDARMLSKSPIEERTVPRSRAGTSGVLPVETASRSPRTNDEFARTAFSPDPGASDGAGEIPVPIWPHAGEVTSGFGPRYGGEHTGLDINGDTGDPVVASASGRVVHTGEYFGYGTTVILDHDGGFATLYGHLSAIDVKLGREVAQGELIGSVGCTGECTGDHLHFEVRIEDEPVDPTPYLPKEHITVPLSPPSAPPAAFGSVR
ncbi:MAG TPA: M23 family metallopeptidase [Actinomycetota bacterium]|nr:M23 family metallopeptidase [Actinomycetota bacterium]